MENASVQVLGVYHVPFTPELLAKAMELKYGGIQLNPQERRDAEDSTRSELTELVLIEVTVDNVDATFDIADFGQPGSDQAPYDEVYLNPEGTAVIGGAYHPPKAKALRIAFFLHFFDETKPLSTSYGAVPLPTPAALPKRLQAITKYEPVD